MAASKISRGPCCEINKLIVQVTGRHHPASQRLAFYEKNSLKRLDALTNEDRPERLNSDHFVGSTLHVWSWQSQFTHCLWLEIEAVEGPPLRVPLPEVSITLRQLDAQWNQIVPVVPFVALPGANSAHDHGTPVLCRAGFIYVFLNDRLWRELEVRVEGEQTTYHDIDLNRYRMGDEIEPGSRLATGQGLEDIWLPSTWNDRQVAPQVCFSEIQLSAPRLRRLEQDPQLREQRCQSPDLRSSRDKYKRLFKDKPDGLAMLEAFSAFDAYNDTNQTAANAARVTWLNLKQHAFPVSVVAPQRARQPGYEWLLDQPGRYLCDLNGQFPAMALGEARQHVARCEKGEAAYQPASLETGAWAHWLEQVCSPETVLDDELWQAQPAVADVLQNARKRELYGVLLHDPHYRLRHLHTRIHDQQHLLHLCAQRASRYAHHASALLVQQLIVPRDIGGRKNPLHKSLDTLNEHARIDINRFTASGERAQVWRQLEMSQALLADSLQQSHAHQTLADHLSLDGFDYAAAQHFVSRLFASLAMTPAHMDPLAVNGDVTDALTGISLYSPKASVGQRLISEIANDEQHPLHVMLWPELESQDLEAPYVRPTVADINRGDGCFRATELFQVSCDPVPAAEQLNTLDASLLAGLLKSGSLNNTLTTVLKVGAAALISWHENLQGAVDTAEQALYTARNMTVLNADRVINPMNMRLRQRALAQLRSILPDAFGDAQFIRRNAAKHKDYYVFGLSDLPEQSNRPQRRYGEYRDRLGEVRGGPKNRWSDSVWSGDTYVVAMPRGHRFAKLISETNQRINTAWQEDLAEQAAQQTTKQNAIQEAVNNRSALKSGRVERALNSTPFAAAVVMLELWNLRNEINSLQQTLREKGKTRAAFGVGGAAIDLLIAMEALTVKLAGTESVLASARMKLFTVSDASAKRVLGPLSKYFLKEFTARSIAQVAAGAIFVGLNLYDAWYAWQWADDAVWGHLVMAAGGVAGLTGTLMVAGTTFLGLGPAGWVSLMLISMGAGLVYWLASNSIEDWLRAGPFGLESNKATHLQDPKQAFYYLVSLFTDIRILIKPNPEYEFAAKLNDNPVPYEVRNADTCIRIESNLPGLLNGLGELGINTEFMLQKIYVLTDGLKGKTIQHTVRDRETRPNAYRLWPDALEVFVETRGSSAYDRSQWSNLVALHCEWLVRAQLRLSDGDANWVFPAPLPKDPTPFGPAYVTPDFDNVGRLFWADEITHKASDRS